MIIQIFCCPEGTEDRWKKGIYTDGVSLKHTSDYTIYSCVPIDKTGQLLLTKDARSLAVEFPSVFSRLEEQCNSKDDERPIKDLSSIIKFEDQISEQLKQVIKLTSYSTMQIGGNIVLYSFERMLIS